MALDMTGAGAALLGGVGDVFGGVINNLFAGWREQNARKENYKYNEMAANNADARTRSLYWDIQSPEALLQQYQQAGLSPSLMFGGGGVGGQTTQGAQGAGATGVSPTTYGVNPLGAAQLALMNAQTKKTEAEAETIAGENERGRAEIDQIIEKTGNIHLNSEVEALEVMLKNFDVAIKGEWGEKTAHAEYENLIATGNNLRATLRKLNAEGKISEESADAVIKYYQQRVIEQQADIFLKQTDAQLKQAQIILTKEQVAGILADIGYKQGILQLEGQKISIARDKLDATINQWCIENGLTKREQNIKLTNVISNFILGNNENGARLIEAFMPLTKPKK